MAMHYNKFDSVMQFSICLFKYKVPMEILKNPNGIFDDINSTKQIYTSYLFCFMKSFKLP